jgi:hypothetical protein
MALLIYEGWDYQTTTPGADFGAGASPNYGYNNWTGGAGTGPTPGLLGGKVLNSVNAGGFGQWQFPSANTNPIVFGFRLSPLVTGGGPWAQVIFFDSAGAQQLIFGLNTSNKISVCRGSMATVIATGTTTILNNAWFAIEAQFTISTTVGAVKVIVNGNQSSPEINLTNINTQATGNPNVAFVNLCGQATGSPGNPQQYLDDFYLMDTTGSAPYNTFLTANGLPWRIETLFPTSNNSVAFTPNASTNVSQVQETSSDNDTTFNVASAAAVDTFNHGSLVSTPSVILACMVTAKVRKDDVTTQNARTKLISGVTTANGTTYSGLNTAYQYIQDMYVNDPATAAAWANAAAVNGTKIGYERL